MRSARLTAAASAKQKLSTRFQAQRKQPTHRLAEATSSVKRAKTFSLGGGGGGGGAAHVLLQPATYKTLPKQASSRSLGSSTSCSTDSSQGSQSTASSRKSSDSSNLSDSGSSSGAGASPPDISPEAMTEIAAFEKFIEKYFQTAEVNNNNNNSSGGGGRSSSQSNGGGGRPPKGGGKPANGRMKPKVSAGSSLAEVLELSI